MSLADENKAGCRKPYLVAILISAVVFIASLWGMKSYEQHSAVQGVRLALEQKLPDVDLKIAGSVKHVEALWPLYESQGLSRDSFDRVVGPIVQSHFTLLPEFIATLTAVLVFFLVKLVMLGRQRASRYTKIVEQRETELAFCQAKLEEVSVEDEATGLVNRGQFNATLDIECRRAVREFAPLSLFLLEPDESILTHLNDSEKGQLIQTIAADLKQTVFRPGDVVARIDEYRFALILPATNEQSPQLAERLRQQAEKMTIGGYPVTVSIGVSTMQPSAQLSADAIQATTEKVLSEAKCAGGNKVCFSTEEPVEVPVTWSE